MVADAFFCLEILKRQSTEEHIHRCKKWFYRSGGFYYDSASNLPTVAIHSMVGATGGISLRSQHDMPRGLCTICHSQEILADFPTTRLKIFWHMAQQWQWYANGRPNHCRKCQHSPIVSKIQWIWRTCFCILVHGCAVRTIALRQAIF
jgi:hypothetical protein